MKRLLITALLALVAGCNFSFLEAGRNSGWDGASYHNNSQSQWVMASKLIRRSLPKNNESVLDIGCGDGKLTAMIAQQVRGGRVVGIDLSESMVDFANSSYAPNSTNNLFFYKMDAQNLPFNNEFDVIYSFSTFHLISNHQALFHGIRKSLKPNGRVAFNQPLGVPQPLQAAINEVIKRERWAHYFRNYVPDWYYMDTHYCFYTLDRAGFQVQRIETIDQTDRLADKETFKNFISQWLCYLDAVPAWDWDQFMDDIVEKYLTILPLDTNGRVLFPQKVLEVEATVR